jgi:hypothetical protein
MSRALPSDKADRTGAGSTGSLATAGEGEGSTVATGSGDDEGVGSGAAVGSVDAEGTGDGAATAPGSFGAIGLQPAAASKSKATPNNAEARTRASEAAKVTSDNYWILAKCVSISALSPGFNSDAWV